MSGPELTPAVPTPRRYRAYLGWVGVLLGSLALTAWHAGVEPSRVAELASGDSAAFRDTWAGLFRPDLSAATVARVAGLAVDSLAIGVLGTALALVLGVALSLVAARWPELPHAPPAGRFWRRARRLLRALSRACLATFRAIPEIIWAYAFVRVLGLGPGAAVLAIGVSFAGVLGRLYAELIESVPPGSSRALEGMGSGRLAIFLYGVLPQVRQQWTAYGLFRLECAIRSGAILGIVGAGGLGQELELSLRYYQFDKLATTLLAVLALVAALELFSRWLRRRALKILLVLAAAATAAAALRLDVDWAELASPAALSRLRGFWDSFGAPTGALGFWSRAAGYAAQTVAMAWSATGLAALGGLPLAFLATWMLPRAHALPAPPGRIGFGRPVALAVALGARASAQLTRSLPELVWALLFILWLGPGVTAGALAIAVHNLGILGRLYSDVLEEVAPAPVRALEAAGGSRLACFVYGALPAASARMASFTLYRFEVNIRATTMVGFVGAGGLGDALHTALSLFHMADLAALITALIVTVVVTDSIGDRLRRRLLGELP